MVFWFRFLSRLPLPLLHNLGAVLGWLIWLAAPRYRRRMRANLRQAGLEGAWPRAVAEAGKSVLELPKIWLAPQEEVGALVVKVEGWQHVEAAHARGRGILFLTPHLGCYEIAAQYYAAWRPITVLYRRPRKDWLARLMEEGRGARLNLAPADLSGVRRLLIALRKGQAVGLLPDQVPQKGEGMWSLFFGRPAYTMTLAARLAEGGATVIMAWAERLLYGAGYRLWFHPLELPREASLEQRVALINHELERLIRQCPEQYLWAYHRYKQPADVSAPPESADPAS